jgi:hypothetical protein
MPKTVKGKKPADAIGHPVRLERSELRHRFVAIISRFSQRKRPCLKAPFWRWIPIEWESGLSAVGSPPASSKASRGPDVRQHVRGQARRSAASRWRHSAMKNALFIAARILLGLLFVVFGLNGFLAFILNPPSIPQNVMTFLE